jgi:enoyl-CoA hydratase/carnithine racemase
VTDTAEIVAERRGPVLVLRLNRPEARNALSWPMIRDIGAGVAGAESDPETRVVVLTGAGDRAFCAGMDLRAFAEADGGGSIPAEREAGMADYLRLLDGDVRIPVVGAVNGSAVAGGFELMLACDVVVASADATFGLPEVKRGLFPGTGVMHIGSRMPLGVALELALTGDRIDATRAYELGLVNIVVAPGEVLATALGVAERIAANGPLAVAATKELVRMATAGSPRAAERLDEWRAIVFGSEDAKEGARAFVEKREPRWQGR